MSVGQFVSHGYNSRIDVRIFLNLDPMSTRWGQQHLSFSAGLPVVFLLGFSNFCTKAEDMMVYCLIFEKE